MSEQEENNTQEQEEKPAKGKKTFGNTIVLFIVFFIIFTVLVTGVAFFADKIKNGKKDDKVTEAQMKEQMTDPNKGKEEAYVIDDKGNVAKNEAPAEKTAQPAQPAPAQPASVLTSPPVMPKVLAQEPAKAAPVKQETKPAEPKQAPAVKTEAPKSVSKPVTEKTAVKSEAPKTAAKTAPKTTAAKTADKPAVKVTPVIPGDYHVQLASFKSLDVAEDEYRRWSSKVSDLQLVKVDLGDKGVWYRLRCGTALSHESAKARAAQIESITGYKPDIMK